MILVYQPALVEVLGFILKSVAQFPSHQEGAVEGWREDCFNDPPERNKTPLWKYDAHSTYISKGDKSAALDT